MHCIPQGIVFEIVRAHSVSPIEVAHSERISKKFQSRTLHRKFRWSALILAAVVVAINPPTWHFKFCSS